MCLVQSEHQARLLINSHVFQKYVHTVKKKTLLKKKISRFVRMRIYLGILVRITIRFSQIMQRY